MVGARPPVLVPGLHLILCFLKPRLPTGDARQRQTTSWAAGNKPDAENVLRIHMTNKRNGTRGGDEQHVVT
jgi:hypothetical protein